MGHAAARSRHGAHRPPAPPAGPRRRRQATIEENVARAKAEYVAGRIEADELERAVEHAFAGGMGCAEFPFLAAFEAVEMEAILE